MFKVFLYDEFCPEDNAMLQALYSRSPKSVTEHVEKVKASGSGKFMSTFYVGYGHSSIADCGSTTLFIEGLSILADKAVQDWPLYSGQETSTRYVDMAKQPVIDPLETKESKVVIDNWMLFYKRASDPLKEHLRKLYPIKEGQKEGIYEEIDGQRFMMEFAMTSNDYWAMDMRYGSDKLYAELTQSQLGNIARLLQSYLKS